MDDRSVERLLSLRAEHAEGPIWDAPTARLWWVDITAERVANNAPLEQAMPWTTRCVQRLHGARGTDPAGQFALLRGPVGWPFRPARPAHQAGQHQRRVHQAGLDAPQGPQGHDEDGALRRRQRARQRAGRFNPGPCCNNPFVRDPEGALIDHHEGINGVGDLDTAVDGWTGARDHHRAGVLAFGYRAQDEPITRRSFASSASARIYGSSPVFGAPSRLSVTAPSSTSGRSEADRQEAAGSPVGARTSHNPPNPLTLWHRT